MSNVKDVRIQARVPWDWCSSLPDSEAAFVGGLFLNPVIGLRIEQQDDGYDPVPDTGGTRSMFLVTIEGKEALAHGALVRLVAALARTEGGQVYVGEVLDLEYSDHEEWAHIDAQLLTPERA